MSQKKDLNKELLITRRFQYKSNKKFFHALKSVLVEITTQITSFDHWSVFFLKDSHPHPNLLVVSLGIMVILFQKFHTISLQSVHLHYGIPMEQLLRTATFLVYNLATFSLMLPTQSMYPVKMFLFRCGLQ